MPQMIWTRTARNRYRLDVAGLTALVSQPMSLVTQSWEWFVCARTAGDQPGALLLGGGAVATLQDALASAEDLIRSNSSAHDWLDAMMETENA